MLFQRKSFIETIRLMTPDDFILFRDSAEKGAFEVLCMRKSKYCCDSRVLMKAVFHSEDSNIYSDDVGVIGEPFLANAQDVLSALSGKEAYAEYKDGLFDGVSVHRSMFNDNSKADDSPYHRLTILKESVKEYEKEVAPELVLTIPAGQHQIITKNVKKFTSTDTIRPFLNSVHFHFAYTNSIRVAATDGRSLIVYTLPGKIEDDKKDKKYSISPDMLFVPAFQYEAAVYEFSKEVVKVVVRGKDSDPSVFAYAVALEWVDLHVARKELEGLVNGDERTIAQSGFSDVKKRIKQLEEQIKKYLKEGTNGGFPSYEKVIPTDNTEKVTVNREEISLALDKIKRFFDRKEGNFIIEALDPENVCLTTYTDLNEYRGIEYIDTKLPLKKVTVSRPVRLFFTRECFEKCCLDGADNTEFRMKNIKRAFLTEGVDFCKKASVEVQKIFMPINTPKTFSDYGEAPEVSVTTTNEEDLARINAEKNNDEVNDD